MPREGDCSKRFYKPPRKLLAELQTAVLQSDSITYALEEFQRQLAAALSAMNDNLCRARDRKAQLEQELANLIGAIASTGHMPSIAEAIGERERQHRIITEQLLGTEQHAVTPKLQDLREFVTERLTDIRALVTSDVERARVELTKHVTHITLQPQQDHYVATGE